jgi:4-amino-4-deoxy-L-arabinose transferase-like glycosyltransferase
VLSLLSNKKSLSFDGKFTLGKTILFVLICFAWLIPGLTGHSPWKYDEAVSQGIVYHLNHGGHWLYPTLGGEPYFNTPPFYFWVAALIQRVFEGWVNPADAARLASGLFMTLTFIVTALGGYTLFGTRAMRASVILLMGCVGLLLRAHEMSSHLSWITGTAMVLAAIPWSRNQSLWAGLLAGTGLGIAFLSIGPIAVGLLLPLMIFSPVVIKPVKPSNTLFYILAIILSLAPFLIIWPYALHLHHPHEFQQWWIRLVEPFLHPEKWFILTTSPFYYLGVSIWFAFPAGPLSLGVIWYGGKTLRSRPSIRFIMLAILWFYFVLGFCTQPNEFYVLVLLVPLSLLAGGNIDLLKRGTAHALDWFGMITFGLITTALWLGWIAQLLNFPESIVNLLDDKLPGYRAQFHTLPFLFALFITLLWIVTIMRSHQNARRALINWSVGLTVTWLLLMTLWLPYIERARGYTSVMASLSTHLVNNNQDCIASLGLGEPQRGLLEYYLNLHTERLEINRGKNCPLILIQDNPRHRIYPAIKGTLLWSGSRPGDHNERLYLYSKS